MDPENAHPAESRPPTVRDLVVNLMRMACGIAYAEAEADIEIFTVEGIAIPFASARLLLRTKQTHREKDAEDRLFLQHKIATGG